MTFNLGLGRDFHAESRERELDQEPESRSRRTFLKSVALGSDLPALITTARGENVFEIRRTEWLLESGTFGPNDRIQIATIGMGIIGFIDTKTALKVPGVELVAISDLYEGRRVHAREVFGDRIRAARRLS